MSQPVLSSMVETLMRAWPDIVAREGLDPLPLGNVDTVSFGPCPWACTDAAFVDLVGLSTLEIDPVAVTCRAQRCDAAVPVVEFEVPFSLRVLRASVVAHAQLSGLPMTLHPVADFGPASGHLRVRVPFTTTGFAGLTALLDVARTSVDVYVNLQRVTHAENVPVGLFNAVLEAGLKREFSALLHAKVSTLATDLVRRGAPQQPVAWSALLIPGFFDAAPSPDAAAGPCAGVAAQQAANAGGACAPCDTCCACAAQERCADPACGACGACMPAEACATSVSWKLWALGAAAGLGVLLVLFALSFVVVLVALGCWGLGKGLYNAVPIPLAASEAASSAASSAALALALAPYAYK